MAGGMKINEYYYHSSTEENNYLANYIVSMKDDAGYGLNEKKHKRFVRAMAAF